MQKITPEELKQKIEKIRQGDIKKKDSEFVRSLTLVTSLGFAIVICIGFGAYLGDIAVKKTGNALYFPLFLFIGIIFAAYTAYKLLKPFLK